MRAGDLGGRGAGKTNLAAQLAARCGNAGVSTLLIDADIRRASLCRLLDIAEGVGLSDLLKGEAQLSDVLLPVQGEFFDLLAAGTPVLDTSRLFQGRNFAMQLAELRQRYEMIIIDSPPVLPVPDALMLGRWTDGVLLAARFEFSRSQHVERARRTARQRGNTRARHGDQRPAIFGCVLRQALYNRKRSSGPSASETSEPGERSDTFDAPDAPESA